MKLSPILIIKKQANILIRKCKIMNSNINTTIATFIKDVFPNREFIPLHEPFFAGNEKEYLLNTIDTTFVSSVGEYVNRFEAEIATYTGAKHAVACVNGTNALHIAMVVSGIKANEEVLTQALTFIATSNAISYIGAKPVYIDVDTDTLGMSPNSLKKFLDEFAIKRDDGYTYNKLTNRRIAACIPMHTFGFPLRIDEIKKLCDEWNIILIEDAAESLGSFYKNIHTGRWGEIGVFSFNGNKTITCGGGGALITDNSATAKKIKHLTTQAKVPHRWKFIHDEIGYNYRMPNLNAALACAQLEQIDFILERKRKLSEEYSLFFESINVPFVKEINDAHANYWLNAIILTDKYVQNDFLEFSNSNGIMSRPIWELMSNLSMFKDCQNDGLANSIWLSERVVNIPSSVRR